MSRLSEDNYQRGGYNGNVETFGDYNTGETPQPSMKERQTMRTNDTNSENVRLYITIRGAPDSVTEYKKLIIMTSSKFYQHLSVNSYSEYKNFFVEKTD